MPYDNPIRQEPPVYIIMESSPLIAEDIYGALHAGGPCNVVKVTSVEELEMAIAPGGPVAAVFLEMRFEDVLVSPLYPALMLTGAKIVLTIGEDDETAVLGQGWAMLVRPFTEDMIHHSLRSSVREL
ncbi:MULTISPECIES: hypothetical protein [unclassified Yoonia]|uniref:hypothetical protein n=1 Tax=unclassified Yoonia TaxID=2629118 RepID=UPI002B000F0B|nr:MULTISPECIES: hypothetical protein [unclassified Yoonia]